VHYLCEKLLFVLVENICRFHHHAAAECVFAMVDARRHYNHILLRCISTGEGLAQIVKIARITDRHQNVALPYAQGTASQFLVAIHTKLLKTSDLTSTLLRNPPLGNGENGVKNNCEDHACDGCILFRE